MQCCVEVIYVCTSRSAIVQKRPLCGVWAFKCGACCQQQRLNAGLSGRPTSDRITSFCSCWCALLFVLIVVVVLVVVAVLVFVLVAVVVLI